jgi:hypothetical protein
MIATADAEAHQDADALAGLVARQRDLYVRLNAQAERQSALITGNEPERLLELLGERQRLIEELSSLNEEMRPYRKNWPALRRTVSARQAQHIEGLLGEVQSLLTRIMAQDEKDAQLLAARRTATAEAMSGVRSGRQAGRAYVASAESESGREWTEE